MRYFLYCKIVLLYILNFLEFPYRHVRVCTLHTYISLHTLLLSMDYTVYTVQSVVLYTVYRIHSSLYTRILCWKYPCGSNLYTWRIRKVIGFDKNFCTSDNQFFIKFWLLTFSTMEILNLKVGTVPRKFEKYLWLTNRLAQFLP